MTKSDITPNRRELLGGTAALAAATLATKATAQTASEVDLTGRSILITGCSSGFGKLSALHFARSGATVIASMRNLDGGKRPEAEELKDVASKEGLKLSIVEIDVMDPEQVTKGVAEAEEIAGGALDVLVNNAGIAVGGPGELSDEKAMEIMFQTNVMGYQRVARAALPAMRARNQGLIFAVSSQLGRLIIPNIGLYSSTKFGVEAMFESMAYELAPTGVEITIIQPGGYPTKIWENGQRYLAELLEREGEERETAYAQHIEMASGMGGGGTTDPMDVPRAMAEIIAMPAGARPLRRPVHPNTQTSTAANAAMAQIQAAALSNGPYAPWLKAVTEG